MARYYVEQTSPFPYHITARRPNREPFPLPLPVVWDIMQDYLFLAHLKHKLRIHAFTLMPNHIHLIASTSGPPIYLALQEFFRETSKEINRLSGRTNQNWGGRHYKTVLSTELYYSSCLKYVYQNPLRANLCEQAERWPFSTLHGLLGLRPMIIPLEEDTLLFSPWLNEKELGWINTLPNKESLASFRKGLKKRSFEPPRTREGKSHPLRSIRL